MLLLFFCFREAKPVAVDATMGVTIEKGPEAERKEEHENSLEDAKKIAITFDDGPHPVYTEMLLDGLKERGVQASFFVLGKNAEIYPELVSRQQEEGHLIGNHTYSHLQLTKANAEKYEQELLQTAKLLKDITGQEIQYVRPPYGAWNKKYEEKWNMFQTMELFCSMMNMRAACWRHFRLLMLCRNKAMNLSLWTRFCLTKMIRRKMLAEC